VWTTAPARRLSGAWFTAPGKRFSVEAEVEVGAEAEAEVEVEAEAEAEVEVEAVRARGLVEAEVGVRFSGAGEVVLLRFSGAELGWRRRWRWSRCGAYRCFIFGTRVDFERRIRCFGHFCAVKCLSR